MTALKAIAQTIRMHWIIFSLMSTGLIVAYYAVQIAVLYFRLGHFPNYVTIHDYLTNVTQIVRSTPAISDMIPIILDEWVLEIGYMDYNYGHGVAEWTMGILPAKLLIIAISSALISINILLWGKARLSCNHMERHTIAAAAGLGALLTSLVNISLSWVVCCGAPSWIVGLALLGLDVGLAFTIEPFGIWVTLVGLIILAVATLRLASRTPTSQPARLQDSFSLEVA